MSYVGPMGIDDSKASIEVNMSVCLSPFIMPPLNEEGHIALHMSVGRSSCRYKPVHTGQRPDQPPLSPALEKWTDRQWAGLDRGEHMFVLNTAGVSRDPYERSWWAG